MRIALVHSFYRSNAPSGENIVVVRQAQALRMAGHEVLVVARQTDDEMKTQGYELKSAVRVATGRGPDPTPELKAFGPDVTHVHNLFPNFGERWLGTWAGPLVATLHNFRSLCANGLFFRDGATCTKCIKGNPLPALRYACYRGSHAATLPLALHNAGGLRRSRLVSRADRLIALSERSRDIFADSGGAQVARKLVVIHNGIEDTFNGDRSAPRHWVFVGRLSPEKGVRELIEAWPENELLRVAGDGPLLEELRALGRPGVHLLGSVSPQDVDKLLKQSWGLIFPSRWLETGGPPLVVAEAAMHGVPVLARTGSSGADFVEHHGAGRTYLHESQVPRLLDDVRENHAVLSTASREAYLADLNLGSWIQRLEEAYAEAQTIRGTGR